MRKFLTTLFTASAIALPAAAAISAGPVTDGPRSRDHGRADANDESGRAARASAETRRGEGERERPQRAEAPAPAAASGPAEWSRHGMSGVATAPRANENRSSGPAEWSRHGMSGAATAPRANENRSSGNWTRHRAGETPAEAPTSSRPDEPRQHRDGNWSDRRTPSPTRAQDGVTVHRDRPAGSFGNHVANHDGQRNWSREWRNDHRYDWRNYRQTNRTIFRLGTYYDPYGYGYRRWNIGWSMRPSYYRSAFWISDPWRYRLPEVYGPYRWVRYYDDAILVNTWSGEVVDVIYNFFW